MAQNVIETTMEGYDQLPSSVNANPRFRVLTTDGPLLTSSDAAASYDIQNFGRECPVKVRLTLTRAGRITRIEHA
jgi:hypothetical protein